MKILIQMALRNLKENKKWARMSVTGIAISVMLIATIIMFAQGAYESGRDQLLRERNQWNVKVNTSNSTLPKSDAIINSLVRSKVAVFQSNKLDFDDEPMIFAVDNFDYAEDSNLITFASISQGRRPENTREVAIGSDILRYEPDLSIGSLIDVVDFEGETHSLEIVGVLKQASYLQVNGFKEGFDNEIYVQVDPEMKHFKTEITKLFSDHATIFEYNTLVNQLLGLERGFHYLVVLVISLSAILISVISLASIALIYNSFNLSIENKVKQIGLIQSVGASKKQISKMVYFEGFVLSFIGISIGVLLGYGLAQGIAHLLTVRFNALSMKDFVFVPVMNLKVILLIYGVGLLSVFLPIRKGVMRANRVSPIDAIRQTQSLAIPKKHTKTRTWMSFNADLANKNIKRSKSKHKGTTLSLIVTMVVLISMSTFIGFFRQQISLHEMDMEYGVSASEYLREGEPSAMNALLDLADSNLYEAVVHYTSHHEGLAKRIIPSAEFDPYLKEGYISSIAANFIYISDADFKELLQEQNIQLEAGTELIMNRYHGMLTKENQKAIVVDVKVSDLEVGDVLSIEDYRSSEARYDLKIGAFIEALPKGVSSNLANLNLVILRPISLFDFESKDYYAFASFKTEKHQALEQNLSEIIKDEDYGIHVSDAIQNNLVQNAAIESVVLIINIGAVFILLICVSNVINVVVSGLNTRRRENAILRSGGMLSSDIRTMLIYEALFTSVKPWVLGNLIGISISFVMYLVVKSQIPMDRFVLNLNAMLFSWLMVLVVLCVNIFYSLSYMKKESIIDDLKSDTL